MGIDREALEGTPPVLVHGGFGPADMFHGVVDRLAEGGQVVTVGHGDVFQVRELAGVGADFLDRIDRAADRGV